MIENTTMKSNFLVDRRMIHKNTHSRMMQASRNMVYFFILSSVSFRYRKYSESRAQKKKNSFIFLVPRRLLYYPNMSESRAQKKKNSFIFLMPRRLLYYPNMSESRAQKKKNSFIFLMPRRLPYCPNCSKSYVDVRLLEGFFFWIYCSGDAGRAAERLEVSFCLTICQRAVIAEDLA